MNPPLPLCPSCRKLTYHHCAPEVSPTCDLVECRRCRMFGTADFKRWSPTRRRKD